MTDFQEEPLLREPEDPFDFFTINPKYSKLETFGDKQNDSHWVAKEVDLSKDRANMDELRKKTDIVSILIVFILENIMGFFFTSDGIVFRNIGENFKEEIKLKEVKYTYTHFEAMELTHNKSYGLQLMALVSDKKRYNQLVHSITEIATIKAKADWAIQWMDKKTKKFAERLMAFAAVEGIFFSSSFMFIYWIKNKLKGKFVGVTNYNHMIARDERLHVEFTCTLIREFIVNKPSYERMKEIIESAVTLEIDFFTYMLRNPIDSKIRDIPDLPLEDVIKHIQFTANMIVDWMGYDVIYKDVKKTPFNFMEGITLVPKKDFFNTNATEYSKVVHGDDDDSDF